MDKIQGIDSYVKSMSATIQDKCWWAYRIPSDIRTVIDFGCAQGDLGLYLDKLKPNRFRYIGVDNSDEMLSLARHNHYLHFHKGDSIFCSELSDVLNQCDPKNTILVLNSVVHEIFSYMPLSQSNALLSEMFGAGFRFVAIRDMYKHNSGNIDADMFDIAMCNSQYAWMWDAYNSYIQSEFVPGYMSTEDRIAEFLLKYRYENNWEREMKETYLWDWLPMIEHYYRSGNYRITYEDNFFIPYIRQHFIEDIGVQFLFNTHKKVLFEL